MLTMRGKYGLKAMIYLAQLPAGTLAQSPEIAESCDISKKYLDAILADLRTAGLVAARKGRHGGYVLCRPPEELMAGHIIRTLDGPLAPFPCARRTGYVRCNDCKDEDRCAIRLTMLEVREAIVSVLDHKTLAQMARLDREGVSAGFGLSEAAVTSL